VVTFFLLVLRAKSNIAHIKKPDEKAAERIKDEEIKVVGNDGLKLIVEKVNGEKES